MNYQSEFIKAVNYDCSHTPCAFCKYILIDGDCGATQEHFPKWWAEHKELKEGEDFEKIRKP